MHALSVQSEGGNTARAPGGTWEMFAIRLATMITLLLLILGAGTCVWIGAWEGSHGDSWLMNAGLGEVMLAMGLYLAMPCLAVTFMIGSTLFTRWRRPWFLDTAAQRRRAGRVAAGSAVAIQLGYVTLLLVGYSPSTARPLILAVGAGVATITLTWTFSPPVSTLLVASAIGGALPTVLLFLRSQFGGDATFAAECRNRALLFTTAVQVMLSLFSLPRLLMNWDGGEGTEAGGGLNWNLWYLVVLQISDAATAVADLPLQTKLEEPFSPLEVFVTVTAPALLFVAATASPAFVLWKSASDGLWHEEGTEAENNERADDTPRSGSDQMNHLCRSLCLSCDIPLLMVRTGMLTSSPTQHPLAAAMVIKNAAFVFVALFNNLDDSEAREADSLIGSRRDHTVF